MLRLLWLVLLQILSSLNSCTVFISKYNVDEMVTLRKTVKETRFDCVRNKDIRNECKEQDMSDWIKRRNHVWDSHVTRMNISRIVN